MQLMNKQSSYLESVIRQNLSEANWLWLDGKAELVRKGENRSALPEAFARIPGKTGNEKIAPGTIRQTAANMKPGEIYIQDWPIDRLSRVWLLLQIDSSVKTDYLAKTGALFSGASMNEQVALYSALPVLAYPEEWKMRCAEGIRSNIGSVLEAVMYENAYPFFYLDEAAFNQMVLKAFFTDKNVDRIIGLDQRANRELANILADYAHERWAAGRTVNPQLWRLTGKYIDAGNFSDIERLWNTGNAMEKKAALLACSQADYEPARNLWESNGDIKKEIVNKKINWHNLGA
jgi:hypothetical protein